MQESSRRVCEALVGHMFLNGDKMSYSTTLTVETMLVFLEYIFQFFINNAPPAVNSVDRENFNLTRIFNITCRGAIDNALTAHGSGPGFDSRRRKLFFLFLVFLFFVVFFFPKTYFHFLTDLKYTGRLIAGSLSAYISKIQ